jgi:hypothetical protein
MGNHQAILDAFTVVTQTLASDTLRVVYTPGKGRGVIAMRTFDVGEIIEIVPVLVVQNSDLVDQTELANYVYNWPTGENAVAVAFGCGSLYNHSYEPNADHEIDRVNELMRHYALRDIAAGEELTLNYGEENASMFLGKDPSPCQ